MVVYLIYILIYLTVAAPTHVGNFMSKESDRAKFIRLAENRVNRAIKDIKLIGNLSNKSNYAYTDADARKIYKAVKEALDEMHARFSSKGNGTGSEFKI